jgi:BirA family biotin operon repressor/biotin-[acetyl-CoA-carboxylase] ligase
MYTLNSLKSNHLLLSALTIHHESFPKKNIGHSFHELDTIDSTNSYAMQKVQEKLAEHGTVYFAQHQTSGKGTRGKGWEAKYGENITISMVIDVKFLAIHQQFFFSAAIALAVFDFFFKYAGEGCSIKWPNDLFFNDSKAAGILIENSIQGNQWQWAIVGIGININQTDFGNDAPNAISLAQITGAQFDIITLAKELCNYVEARYQELQTHQFDKIIQEYNNHLYKKNMPIKLKKNSISFECIIDGVAANGDLLVKNGLQSSFTFGEVIWEIPKIK